MDEGSNNLELFKFLQPELLTVAELSSVLKSRCVKANWSLLSKEKLVELFKRVALPLPQREYPQTTRGIKLTKLRRKLGNSIKFEDSSTCNEKTYTIGVNGVGTNSAIKSIITDSLKPPLCIQSSTVGDRLKPPPKTDKVENRKIKINFCSSTESQLDKVVINNHKKQRLEENATTVKHCEQSSSENNTVTKPKVHTTKKITLKRNNLCSQMDSAKKDEEKSVTVEKKRKVITWP